MIKYIIFCMIANAADFGLLCFMMSSRNWAFLLLFMVLVPIAVYFSLEGFFECTLSKSFSETKNAVLLTLCQILIWCVTEFVVCFIGVYILSSGGGSGALGLMLLIGAPFSSTFIVLMPLIKGIRLLARRKD